MTSTELTHAPVAARPRGAAPPEPARLPPPPGARSGSAATGERRAGSGDLWLLNALLAVALIWTLAAEPAVRGPVAQPLLVRHRVALATATDAELQAIPGVGPVLAAAIVAERRRARFTTPADLRRVHGIGPQLERRIAQYARFRTDARFRR